MNPGKKYNLRELLAVIMFSFSMYLVLEKKLNVRLALARKEYQFLRVTREVG